MYNVTTAPSATFDTNCTKEGKTTALMFSAFDPNLLKGVDAV
jgi:hypothetical protein